MKKVLILGAGLGGLSAGWQLSKLGFEVLILEKETFNGGLAVTKEKEGCRYDLGPHNIHTNHNSVLSFLKKSFSDLYEYFPTVKVCRKDKMLPYPVVGASVLTSLTWWKQPLAVMNLLVARFFSFIFFFKSENSFSEWIKNRFGSTLYKEYFFDYPRKVWRLHPNDIDKLVAEKRIPVTSLFQMILALFHIPYKMEHPETQSKNYYLGNGIGAIATFFEAEIKKNGGRIQNNVSIEEITIQKNKITGVKFKAIGEATYESCDFLLSTIPINELIELIPDVSNEVMEASTALEYCASLLFYVRVGRSQVLPSSVLYFSDKGVLFSRVSAMESFSEQMVPEGKSLLCFEFPCLVDDFIWNFSEENLLKHVLKVLESKKIMRAEEVEKTFLERLTHSYPRFRLGYQQPLNVCFDYIKKISNCYSYGRQGGFSYLNSDGVIEQGFSVAEKVSKSVGVST